MAAQAELVPAEQRARGERGDLGGRAANQVRDPGLACPAAPPGLSARTAQRGRRAVSEPEEGDPQRLAAGRDGGLGDLAGRPAVPERGQELLSGNRQQRVQPGRGVSADGPAETGPAETGPAETGPSATGSAAAA